MIVWAVPLIALLLPGDALTTAREQVRHGDCQAAVETLMPVVQSGTKPVEDAPIQLLAACLERLGQADRAVETLRSGLRTKPDSAAIKKTLGEVLFRQAPDNAEAGQLLGDAVKGDPQDPEARHYYAQWASLNNRDQICADQEQAAVKLHGLNDIALLQMYSLLGICLSHLEQTGPADAAFQKAFEIDLHQQPFNPAMAYQYIQFLTSRGRAEQANKVVNETLHRSPNFGPAHLERAKSFDHERQTEKVIEEAKAALAGDGDDDANVRAAHVLLAKSYFILGKTKEAEAEQQWVESHASATHP
jgi:tetratricopeptide (TPR) repeat protein